MGVARQLIGLEPHLPIGLFHLARQIIDVNGFLVEGCLSCWYYHVLPVVPLFNVRKLTVCGGLCLSLVVSHELIVHGIDIGGHSNGPFDRLALVLVSLTRYMLDDQSY